MFLVLSGLTALERRLCPPETWTLENLLLDLPIVSIVVPFFG